jgi:hypothetical protein
MNFEIISEIINIEPIAVSNDIRDIQRLRKAYGKGKWRKLKGIALIRLVTGRIRRVELHWYEASGVGRKEIKRKRYLTYLSLIFKRLFISPPAFVQKMTKSGRLYIKNYQETKACLMDTWSKWRIDP